MLDSTFGAHLLDEDFLICGEDSCEVQVTSFIFMTIFEMTCQGNMPHQGPKKGNIRTTRTDVNAIP